METNSIQPGDAADELRAELHAAEEDLRARDVAFDHEEGPLRKLLGVAEQINATLDVDRVLNLAAARIIEIFEAERVFILEAAPSRPIRFRFTACFDGASISRPELEVSHAVIREVAERRVPILVRDATTDGRFANVSSVQNLQLHSVMAAPLLALGELQGVIYADNRRLSGVFTPRTLDLLSLFANHIGIALHNAQLFRELNATRAELARAERLQAIGQVAAFIVHDMKNPLTSVRVLTQAMKEQWAEEAVREKFFEIVPPELDRLYETLRQVLEYARPTPVIRVPLTLGGVLDSAMAALEPEAAQHDVRVVKAYDRELPRAEIDGERMRGAFVNLIKNALEAMQGRSKRELKLILRRADEAHVEAVIEDTGPGITETELPHLFEPFRTDKPGGTGLGLAFCQKLVREHGGTITAENKAGGEGARFRVVLPISGS